MRFDATTKVFPGDVVAVDNLSLEVGDGEFLILVGPSGCGKTTALRMVAGLEKISAGTIAIGDQVVNHVPPKERDIAMVFQNYALYPHMTVRRNLAFGLKSRRLDKDEIRRRVHEIAEMLGLADLLDRRPGQLSGGQRQRVAMGRALVREPAVFLLDEPLSNLDAKLRVQMRAELKKLHQRLAITTIYVTHDQVEAMTLGEQIAVLAEGRLQQVGSPQDIYDRPTNVFVAGFIGSPPMSLLRGRAEDGGIVAGDLRLPRADVPAGDVIVGIRPESLHPVGDGAVGPSFDFLVEVVEPLGDEVLAHGSVAAADAGIRIEPEPAALLADRPTDRAAVTMRLQPHDRPDVGSRLRVGVAPEAVHVFDASSGAAIP